MVEEHVAPCSFVYLSFYLLNHALFQNGGVTVACNLLVLFFFAYRTYETVSVCALMHFTSHEWGSFNGHLNSILRNTSKRYNRYRTLLTTSKPSQAPACNLLKYTLSCIMILHTHNLARYITYDMARSLCVFFMV